MRGPGPGAVRRIKCAPFERQPQWPTRGKMANTIGIKINYEPLVRSQSRPEERPTQGQRPGEGHKSSGQAVAPKVPPHLQLLFTH